MVSPDNPLEIHDELKENLELKESETAVVHGMISGNIFVRGNSTLILHGIIRGNVIVEGQGTFFLHGMVYGDVTNNSGTIRHYEMIKGKLNKLSGETIVHSRAMICGDEY